MEIGKGFRVCGIDVGTTNMGLCIVRYDDSRPLMPYVIEHWEKINLHAHTIDHATQEMVRAFINRPQCYNVDVVIIESQEKAVEKMKRLSNAIQAHFLTRRADNKDFEYTVTWCSGGSKLKVYTGPELWEPVKLKDKRLCNKRIGEHHTKALLQIGIDQGYADCERWKKWFDVLLKADDVADAFLMAAHYIKKHVIGNPKKRKPAARKRIPDECVIIDDDDGDGDGGSSAKKHAK